MKISTATRSALRDRLAAKAVDAWLDSLRDLPAVDVDHATALEALDEARESS